VPRAIRAAVVDDEDPDFTGSAAAPGRRPAACAVPLEVSEELIEAGSSRASSLYAGKTIVRLAYGIRRSLRGESAVEGAA